MAKQRAQAAPCELPCWCGVQSAVRSGSTAPSQGSGCQNLVGMEQCQPKSTSTLRLPGRGGAAAAWQGPRPWPFPAAQQPGSHSWDSWELCCSCRERSPLCRQAAARTTAWVGQGNEQPWEAEEAQQLPTELSFSLAPAQQDLPGHRQGGAAAQSPEQGANKARARQKMEAPESKKSWWQRLAISL